jgi:hypothetical protein
MFPDGKGLEVLIDQDELDVKGKVSSVFPQEVNAEFGKMSGRGPRTRMSNDKRGCVRCSWSVVRCVESPEVEPSFRIVEKRFLSSEERPLPPLSDKNRER